MGTLGLILFGGIVGLLSTMFGSKAPTGLLGAVALGVAGALAGSFLASMLIERPGGFSSMGMFLIPILGAGILLVLRRTMPGAGGGGYIG